MNDRRRRRDAFFKAHPYCCFCGGTSPATTEDHQPGRLFFKGREWPEGFVFPACEPCNAASRLSEKVMALLIHGEADSNDRGKFEGVLRSVNAEFPHLVPSMLPGSTREIRQILAERDVARPEGVAFADLPLIKLDKTFWEPHLTMFARKLLLALHYQCFGSALSSTGAIWHFVHTNFDRAAGEFPEELLQLAKNIAIPSRQKKLLGDQFGIRWNVVPDQRSGLFVAQFHGRLAVSGITTETPERFKKAWKHAPLRPFAQLGDKQ